MRHLVLPKAYRVALALVVAALLVWAPACGPGPAPSATPRAATPDGAPARDIDGAPAPGPADARGAADAPPRGDTPPRADTARPPGDTPGPLPAEVPVPLRAATWVQHLEDDILPYWTMPGAQGSPVGNFPTYRDMNGMPTDTTERRPRMISRQIYTYVAAYLATGDDSLLPLAKAGVDWLLDHARDAERGGWHGLLDGDGDPKNDLPKTAQDTAYAAMGLAAWTFLTRDPEAEAAVLATRDLLFDPATYFDPVHGRIRDALDADLDTEVDVEGDGGWELVAQLDPLNAMLLLVQPVLSDAARRSQVLGDLRVLGDALVTHFFEGGVFWGVHNVRSYGTRHVDFGHTLKSYWMLELIDRRLSDQPYRSLLDTHMAAQIARAFDAQEGRWAKRPTSDTAVEYGSDWWAYAECDQVAATLSLDDGEYAAWLETSARGWLDHYVDRDRDARGVIPGITRDGSAVWGWPDGDTAKCNAWKNGYHAAEHALVMTLLGHGLEGTEAPLYFAIHPDAAADAETFTASPYWFEGTETSREVMGAVRAGDVTLAKTVVRFDALR